MAIIVTRPTYRSHVIVVIVVIVAEVREAELLTRLDVPFSEDGEKWFVKVGFVDVARVYATVRVAAVILQPDQWVCAGLGGRASVGLTM